MGKIRYIFSLWTAKCSRLALKLLGRNATYLPGRIALTLCPDFLARVKKPARIIAVTGTNGKTTVSNLLGDVLRSGKRRVLDNRLGSNVAAGIATSLISGVSAFGKPKTDVAVFEVDERSSARILPYIRPELLVITNLFRDSVMRNAHPEYIAGIIGAYVPRETRLVLNADDLISSAVAAENPRVYFGLEKTDADTSEYTGGTDNAPVCPSCLGTLEYEYRRYLHIGRVKCPECGFASPSYDYSGRLTDSGLTVTDASGTHDYIPLSDNPHNIYNMVTVAAALREFGLSHDEIAEGLQKTKIVDSRYNEDTKSPVTVVMNLAKAGNPSANSRAFDYVRGKPGDKELILMNNLRDHKNWSENVCWLYDADFEFLNDSAITRIVLTGPRAKDYYLRLLLAGVSEDKLRVVSDDLDAPSQMELRRGESVFIFYGTDTIELARRVRGAVKERAGRIGNDA